LGRQEKLIDTIYIDNAVQAHMLAAERLTIGSVLGGKAYFISQGEPVETWNMINRLLDAVSAPKVERTVPLWLARAAAWCLENVYRLARRRDEPRLTSFVVKELSTSHWFDISAARKDFGYEPKISIAEGLTRLKAAWTSA
jgi:nucleoside-diphosphate-sugar epimerase